MSRSQAISRRKLSQKTYYHFSEAEFRAWLAAWRATRAALEDAKVIIEEELKAAASGNETKLRQALIDIEEKIAHHVDLKLSFYANSVALSVPAPGSQNVLEQLADNVDRLIGSADDVTHVHSLAADIFQRFNASTLG